MGRPTTKREIAPGMTFGRRTRLVSNLVALSLTVALLGLGASNATGSPGDLDPSFAEGGRFVGDNLPTGQAVTIQETGEIIVVGRRDTAEQSVDELVVSRFLADGHPDVSFGSSGSVVPAFTGNLAAAGLDVLSASSLAEGRLGVIVRVGPFDDPHLAAVRLLATGEPDLGFGSGDGVIELPSGIVSVEFDAQGLMLYASDGILHRTLESGAPDPDFSGDGSVPIPGEPYASRFTFTPDGKILVASANPVQVTRYLPSGDLDPTFGDGGVSPRIAFDRYVVESVATASDGSVYLQFSTDEIAVSLDHLARLSPNGIPDRDFGEGGKTTVGGEPGEITVDALSRPLLLSRSGGGGMEVRRYLLDGSLDRTYGIRGEAKAFFGLSSSVAIDLAASEDGVVLVGGVARARGDDPVLAMARLSPLDGPNDADADAVLDAVDDCVYVAAQSPRGCPTDHREITIEKTRSSLLRGRLLAATERCATEESVYLFRKQPGRDRRGRIVRLRLIDEGSRWRVDPGLKPGHFYVSTRASFVGRARCSPASSEVVEISR